MVTVTLTEPLKLADGRTLAELEVRQPRVKDQKAAQRFSSDPAEQETALVARMVGLVPEDLEEVLLVDYQRLLAEIFPRQPVVQPG